MQIDFTEEELVVIGKLLGHVAGNKNAYSAQAKVAEALDFELDLEDWDTVKFIYDHTDEEVKDFNLYIKIEETA